MRFFVIILSIFALFSVQLHYNISYAASIPSSTEDTQIYSNNSLYSNLNIEKNLDNSIVGAKEYEKGGMDTSTRIMVIWFSIYVIFLIGAVVYIAV